MMVENIMYNFAPKRIHNYAREAVLTVIVYKTPCRP